MSTSDSEAPPAVPDNTTIELVSGNIAAAPVADKSGFWDKFSRVRMSSGGVLPWLAGRRQKLKPWLQFFNFGNFSKPDSASRWSKRMMRNVDHFQTNYGCVFCVLFVYCLLTSPLLLIALGAVAGACHLLHVRQSERPLVLAGRPVALSQQYAAVALLSVPLFLLVGASGALFWVLGASLFVVLMHASFYGYEALADGDAGSDDTEELFEVAMQPV